MSAVTRRSGRPTSTEAYEQAPAVTLSGDAESGRLIFESNRSFCHYADRTEAKLGTGLKEVLKKGKLPLTGRPATEEMSGSNWSIHSETCTPFAPLSQNSRLSIADLPRDPLMLSTPKNGLILLRCY